jgi:serine/arginine repetitive matrix protein 1
VEQDGRWGKSDLIMIAKMTKAGKFAPILDTKVDLKKVNVDIISKWICEKVTQILGFEDEIISNLIVNLLHAEVSA